MVSWLGIDSYFNIEQIQISDIEIMISSYRLSGSFGSRVRSKSIGHNNYTVRKSNLRSKPTTIHGPAHKYLYGRSQFSRLQQAVAGKTIYRLSQKVSNASNTFDPFMNGFSPND